MSTAGVAWAIGALLGAGGAYALYRMYTPDTLACPKTNALDATIQKIRSGETSEATAETMAASYELAGCLEAASAIRLTIKAHQDAEAPGGVLGRPQSTGKAGPGGGVFGFAPTTPTEDLFDVYHLPNLPPDMLRATVGDLLATAPSAWSYNEINVFAPLYSTRILKAFAAQGTYKPGVTPLSKLTVLNQLNAATAAATAFRVEHTDSSFAPDTEFGPAESGGGGGGGGGGGSGGFSGSASLSGSGGFHL